MSWKTPLVHLALFSFLLLPSTFSVEAQQRSGPYRLGYLSVRADPGREAAFRERLRELGYVEGTICLSNTDTPAPPISFLNMRLG